MIVKKIVRPIIFLLILVFYWGNSHASVQINCDGRDVTTEYIVTNPMGQRLGINPITKEMYKEFESGYGTEGIGDIEGGDQSDVPYSVVSMFEPIDGNYTIDVLGKGLTVFDLNIAISNDAGIKQFNTTGVIDKGLTSKIQFTYSSDPSKPWTVTRVATPGSLKQDITLSRKIGWIDNDGIMTSLLKKAEAIEASIQKDRRKTTENLIKAFINEVNAQAEKHLSKEAVKMLTEDAEYIMNNL